MQRRMRQWRTQAILTLDDHWLQWETIVEHPEIELNLCSGHQVVGPIALPGSIPGGEVQRLPLVQVAPWRIGPGDRRAHLTLGCRAAGCLSNKGVTGTAR